MPARCKYLNTGTVKANWSPSYSDAPLLYEGPSDASSGYFGSGGKILNCFWAFEVPVLVTSIALKFGGGGANYSWELDKSDDGQNWSAIVAPTFEISEFVRDITVTPASPVTVRFARFALAWDINNLPRNSCACYEFRLYNGASFYKAGVGYNYRKRIESY